MSSFTSQEGSSPKFLVDGYDWASLGKVSVVDLGGAQGHIAFALTEKFPHLNVIVEDLPAVVRQAKEALQDENHHVQFMEHDFFKPQPITADVYLLRWILHNYPTQLCLSILRNLVPTLKPGARVIVMDNIVPEPGSVSQMAEREIR